MPLPENLSARRLGLILVGAGAALAGYLGLGVSIWQVAPGILVQVVYFETTLLLSVVILALYQASHITKLEQASLEMAISSANAEQLSHLAQAFFSLVVNWNEEPRVDEVHHFTCITEEFFIRGDDGTFNWTFEGSCTKSRSRALVLKVSGDSPIDVNAMDITVTDAIKRGATLNYDVLVDKAYCKVIQVYFAQGLRQGDSFKIHFSCRWNNTFPKSRRKDYVFSLWASYAGAGIDRIAGRLVVDTTINEFKLMKFDEGSWTATTHQPREIDSSRSRTELEWNITKPEHVYLLSFEKGSS